MCRNLRYLIHAKTSVLAWFSVPIVKPFLASAVHWHPSFISPMSRATCVKLDRFSHRLSRSRCMMFLFDHWWDVTGSDGVRFGYHVTLKARTRVRLFFTWLTIGTSTVFCLFKVLLYSWPTALPYEHARLMLVFSSLSFESPVDYI